MVRQSVGWHNAAMILVIKSLTWIAVSFLLMAGSLFLPAGTFAWPAGWIFLILLHGWLLVGIGLLLKHNPGLLEERLRFSQSNQKPWDKVFIVLYQLLLFAWLALMPLDGVKHHGCECRSFYKLSASCCSQYRFSSYH